MVKSTASCPSTSTLMDASEDCYQSLKGQQEELDQQHVEQQGEFVSPLAFSPKRTRTPTKTKSEENTEATSSGPYIHIDYSFHLMGSSSHHAHPRHLESRFQNSMGSSEFLSDHDDDSDTSSVASGFRCSLHSNYNLCDSTKAVLRRHGDDDNVPARRRSAGSAHTTLTGSSYHSFGDEDLEDDAGEFGEEDDNHAHISVSIEIPIAKGPHSRNDTDSTPKTLDWRLDPEISGSDWTMLVQSVPDGVMHEYNVHQQFLSKGRKRCDYFVTLFQLANDEKVLQIIHENTSVSQIHQDAACLIPDMLDYLYAPQQSCLDLSITTETAVGLRHLSEFFGTEALAQQVSEFICEDVQLSNMHAYLAASKVFDDLQTQKLCAMRCAERASEIQCYCQNNDGGLLLAEMDPSFVLDVLSSPRPADSHHSKHSDNDSTSRSTSTSEHLSRLVADFCDQQHQSSMLVSGQVFEELTSVEFLPIIAEDAAIQLMIMEATLLHEATDATSGLTYLQKRCCDVLYPRVKHQAEMSESKKKIQGKRLKLLPAKVLAELLAGAMDL